MDGNLKYIKKSYLEKYYKALPYFLAIISDDFGSAVCISEKGYILTCAHCTYSDFDLNKKENFLMMFPNGEKVTTKIIKIEEDLELALLQIVKSKKRKTSKYNNYQYIKISEYDSYLIMKIYFAEDSLVFMIWKIQKIKEYIMITSGYGKEKF